MLIFHRKANPVKNSIPGFQPVIPDLKDFTRIFISMLGLLTIPSSRIGLSWETATIKVDICLWSSFLKEVGGNKCGNASVSIIDT